MEEKDIIEQIEKNKKLPKEIKNNIMTEVFECALFAIIVYAYLIFLRLGAKNIYQDVFLADLKVFNVSIVIVAIILFENAYNNKNSKNAYRGIEILFLAIITMLTQYIVLYLTPKYIVVIPLIAIIYNIYYILKTLVIVHKIKKDYRNSLSDIKEIVKKQPKKV